VANPVSESPADIRRHYPGWWIVLPELGMIILAAFYF